VGDPKLEQRVFAMRPGDITEPIQVGDQWALVKCEGHIPPAKTSFDQVRDKLADVIRERKLHTAAADVFQNLHKQAVIQNIYNDPVRSQQMPGVAAIVNDRKITVRELAEECIDKHGAEALEGTVNRRLLEQAVRNKRLTVTDEDLNSEIARAAVAAGKVDKQKRPDMDGWIKTVCEEQGITAEIYYHDAVWPSVALRKLVGDVAVSKDDLDRGFIANYGPRVRCRVIMMTNQRRAQEVWEMARTELQKKNPDPEFFGRLAEQYSVDPSRAVQGRVPPIQRYGGMTQLETAAFALKPGELSGLIAVGDRFVILYCEGYTDPVKVEMAEVKDVLYDDIHQKKLHMAMAEEFNRLKDSAQIDNYLTGTSHVPTRSGALGHGDGERAAVNASSAGEHRK
jgi:parvulin-like peptidyl-prolyl isomerase